MKFDLVLNITNACNYSCSYCNVIKWNKSLSFDAREDFCNFVMKNQDFIERIKFFWWEPLLRFDIIQEIIKNTYKYLWNKYEIVTNTSLLNDDVWRKFSEFFEKIFFSIDSENKFLYTEVKNFIESYTLNKKIFFNIIISPYREQEAFLKFQKLYEMWFYNFNLLPIYFTKAWEKENLISLSKVLKNIIDFSLKDNKIHLFGFQKNNGYNASLVDKALFIDLDGKIYYSDIVVSELGKRYKKDLFIWNIDTLFLSDFWILRNQERFYNILRLIEEENYKKVKWQKELHKIMDYFSTYLNNKRSIW